MEKAKRHMKVDKSNQCFVITPLLDTLSMKTFHQITGTTIALVILSARFMVLLEVNLVYQERKVETWYKKGRDVYGAG